MDIRSHVVRCAGAFTVSLASGNEALDLLVVEAVGTGVVDFLSIVALEGTGSDALDLVDDVIGTIA